jgi:hypothetical protein
MDPDRFDTLTRTMGTTASRRAALGASLAGGLLSALGLARNAPVARAAQGGTCTLAFAANVRLGPSQSQPLTPGGQIGALRGNLVFGVDQAGRLTGELQVPSGERFPVMGQAAGRSMQARIELAQRVALVVMGVGEEEITACRGAIDGMVTGPQVGDLGDWHAVASGGGQGRGGQGQDGQGQGRDGRGGQGGGQNAGGSARGGQGGGQGGQGSGGRTDRGNSGGGRGNSGTPVQGTGGGGRGNQGNGTAPGGNTGGAQRAGDVCPEGQTRCDDECVDLQTDPLNCGACSLPCASELGASTCIEGTCACSPGTTRCDDVCVNTARDPLNCGACGSECLDDTECVDGACAAAQTACPQDQTRCGDACVDTTSDSANCSACGLACPAGEECRGSLCVPIGGGGGCKTGFTPCGPTCADLQTNATNCGACGNACATGEGCVNGKCELATRVCVDPGESCADGDCCIGFCNQDDLCECVSEGAECAQIGTGGCCSGQPCNADGFCGTCTLFGASCTADAECCSGSQYGAGLCCAGVCTDVTNVGFACPCAQLGESCAAVECCVGFCGQDDLCDCASDGRECRSNDECCNGVCNANGFCGTCVLLGATCITTPDCCSGNYAVDCCFDSVELTTTCTDVTATGFCPGETGDRTCAEGFTDCGGVCVDLATNIRHCGSCALICNLDFTDTCEDGRCTSSQQIVAAEEPVVAAEELPAFSCPEGQVDCGAGCIDIVSDPANCGGCGIVCAADQQCFQGACAVA